MKYAIEAALAVVTGSSLISAAGIRQRFRSVGTPAERMNRSDEFSTPDKSAASAMKVR